LDLWDQRVHLALLVPLDQLLLVHLSLQTCQVHREILVVQQGLVRLVVPVHLMVHLYH
jgi:hypothetical protein